MKLLFRQYSLLIFLLLSSSAISSAQNLNPFKKNETPTSKVSMSDAESKSVINDIIQLSSSNMKGRLIGTTGEQVAITYLTRRFRELGLTEVDKNYQRKYTYSTGDVISDESKLIINNLTLKVPTEAFPVSFSSGQKLETFIIDNQNEAHSVWILPAYKNINESKLSKEEQIKIIYNRAKNAIERGAWGIIFYNNFGNEFIMKFQERSLLAALDIPIFEISQTTYNEKFKGLKKFSSVTLEPIIKQNFKPGINLYGIINNGAAKTVVISANYDGYVPEHKLSDKNFYSPGSNMNASGVATVLALASRLKSSSNKSYNYMFILYSGTYKDFIGSKSMLNDKNFFTDKIAFALHYDRVGRLNATKDIFVAGVGTYAGWGSFFSNSNYNYILEAKGSSSSDFLSYLDKKIPYLGFSTGNYDEDGTETDNHSRIKLEGIGEILNMSFYVISELNKNKSNLVFTMPVETVNKRTGEIRNLEPSVSLGVIPDITFKDGGLKISKVNKGQDGDFAGLISGDVIIQIRNYPIQNYDDYLFALSKFKKGEKVFVRILRKGNAIQKVVTFS